MTQLLESTRRLAARQPMLFFGGALAAGFLGARFLRSTAQPSQPESEESGQMETDLMASDASQYGTTAAGMGGSDLVVDPIDTEYGLGATDTLGFGNALNDDDLELLEGNDFGGATAADDAVGSDGL